MSILCKYISNYRFLNFLASYIILASLILSVTPQARADQKENANIGLCIAIFAATMNTAALRNDAGAVKFWSLQYARAYVAYGAMNIGSGGRSRMNEINKEISYYIEKETAFIKSLSSSKLVIKGSECHSFVNPIYVKLELSGVKLDPGRPETLGDIAYAMASVVRKDLGY